MTVTARRRITPPGIEQMMYQVREQFGHLDIMVNDAGIISDKSMAKMEPALWDEE